MTGVPHLWAALGSHVTVRSDDRDDQRSPALETALGDKSFAARRRGPTCGLSELRPSRC